MRGPISRLIYLLSTPGIAWRCSSARVPTPYEPPGARGKYTAPGKIQQGRKRRTVLSTGLRWLFRRRREVVYGSRAVALDAENTRYHLIHLRWALEWDRFSAVQFALSLVVSG